MVGSVKSLTRGVCSFVSAFIIVGSTPSSLQGAEIGPIMRDARSIVVHQWNEFVCRAIMADGLPPPAAARVFAYVHLTGNEVLASTIDTTISFEGRINGFESSVRVDGSECDAIVSVIAAYQYICRLLLRSIPSIDSLASVQLLRYGAGLDQRAIENSLRHGRLVARSIEKYAWDDRYEATRNLPVWQWFGADTCWAPTPPLCAAPVLPLFGSQRPFVLKNPAEHKIAHPLSCSQLPGVALVSACEDVVQTSRSLTTEQRATALYWDDNPLTVVIDGNYLRYHFRMSPGSHWLMIAQSVMDGRSMGLCEVANTYAVLAMAIHDAFIASWHYKYKFMVERPVTLVNRLIDEDWMPVLQTPPFPEYPSAHAVVSSVSECVLSSVFGADFSFVDSTEVPFGHSSRAYQNFAQAAQEATISRHYGGIHYRVSCDEGYRLGLRIGHSVVKRLLRGE